MSKNDAELDKDEGFEKTVRYTEKQLAEFDRIYDEEFTPVWENEGQYCRAGGGQYEKSFAWWAWKKRQEKIDELQKRVDDSIFILSTIDTPDEAYKLIDSLLRTLKGNTNELDQALKGGYKNKYDWSNVPNEVEWIATDSHTGMAQGYVNKPKPTFNMWESNSVKYFLNLPGWLEGHWKESLEQRHHAPSVVKPTNTDDNGKCLHFSTTLFHDGKAECFHCDAVVNEKREVIGKIDKKSKGLQKFFLSKPNK